MTKLGTATMTNRGRTVTNRANTPVENRYKHFRYVVTTATKLDILMVANVEGSVAMSI